MWPVGLFFIAWPSTCEFLPLLLRSCPSLQRCCWIALSNLHDLVIVPPPHSTHSLLHSTHSTHSLLHSTHSTHSLLHSTHSTHSHTHSTHSHTHSFTPHTHSFTPHTPHTHTLTPHTHTLTPSLHTLTLFTLTHTTKTAASESGANVFEVSYFKGDSLSYMKCM